MLDIRNEALQKSKTPVAIVRYILFQLVSVLRSNRLVKLRKLEKGKEL